MYSQSSISKLVQKQRKFFNSGLTLDLSYRIDALKRLKEAIVYYEDDMKIALNKDLGRSDTEGYLLDIGTSITEINEAIRGLKRWARPEIHLSGIMCFPSIYTKVYKMPYGVTLIISPFNFPFYLSFGPLAAALAAGNTACIKVSSKSSNSSRVISKIIARAFKPEYVTVIEGGHDVADFCLNERFDKIFYTGSPRVAKHVMELASKNLTPVALELGGETGNWCVIRKDADLKDAARKIAFFKICNAGQICININQVAVASEVADEFVEYLKQEFIRQIGENPLNNNEYPKMIAKGAYEACAKEVNKYKKLVVFGGKGDDKTLKFEPTILYPVDINEEVVNHELFCPILPIVKYDDNKIDKLMETINSREHGLALYVFTSDMAWANKVMTSSQYGGGCINEVVLHIMTKGVPFNGTGHSGMGAYHGVWGFREFSHPTTVLTGYTKANLPLREHPYDGKMNKWKMFMLRIFER